MKVGVFGSSNKIKNVETVAEIMQWLREAGYEAVEFRSQKEIDGVDVVLVLGGDGAILHSAVIAAQKNIKIIANISLSYLQHRQLLKNKINNTANKPKPIKVAFVIFFILIS